MQIQNVIDISPSAGHHLKRNTVQMNVVIEHYKTDIEQNTNKQKRETHLNRASLFFRDLVHFQFRYLTVLYQYHDFHHNSLANILCQ